MKTVFSAFFLSLSLGALAAPKYSLTQFQRPFTMPENSFESTLMFANDNIMMLKANYGLTDYFQLGLGWGGIDTAGSLATQKLSLFAAQHLFRTQYISGFATAELPLFFNKMVLQEASLGLPTYVPIIRGHLNLVVFENLVNINWLNEPQAHFKLGTRFSWQATHSLCLNLSTALGTLSTRGGHDHIIKATPLMFKAIYAVTPMLDVMGSVGLANIQNATGFSAMLGIGLRGGNIEG